MFNIKRKRKTLGIALGAGGARGACHLGFLRVLEKNGIPIDYIAGCSMGAVIGGCYAATKDLDKIEAVGRRLRQISLMDFGMFNELSRLGIMGGHKSERIIRQFTKSLDTKDTLIPFCCAAADLISGKIVILSEGDLTKNIRASMAIPAIFEPVKMGDMILVDGGILDRVPALAARQMGADVVVGVDALGKASKTAPKRLLEVVARTINIMSYEISKVQFKDADLLITPDMPALSEFRVRDMPDAINAGVKAAEENLDKIRELLK